MNERAPERARSFQRELARKAIHLTSAAIPIALAFGIDQHLALFVLCALAVFALVVELARVTSAIVALRFGALFAPLLRPHEAQRITGATWLLISMLFAVLLLPRDVAIAATWAAAVGDAAAALIGMRFGRHRSSRDGKSIEGSVACFVTTLAGALLLTRLGIGIALLAAVAATVAERLSWPRDDNVRIIAVVGAMAMIAAAL